MVANEAFNPDDRASSGVGDTIPSIIPARKPKKPGMPKLQLPSRPTSSSATSINPVSGNGRLAAPLGGLSLQASSSQPSLHLAIPATNNFSSLNSNSGDDELDDASMHRTLAGPSTITVGSSSMTTTHASIYPDTVVSGPQDAYAMTNDLRRAIGNLTFDENDSGHRTTGSSVTMARSSSAEESVKHTPDGGDVFAGASSLGKPSAFPAQVLARELQKQDQQSSSCQQELEDESEYKLQGNLDVLERLGEGASGEVRKARYRPTGQVMAMKTISTSPNPAIHRQILRELSFNRTCRSEFIVRCYGAFLANEDTSIIICLEHCEAGSLDNIYKRVKARNGRMGEKTLAKIAESGLKGLAYLHTRKIIHRDIKPSNILVTRDGQIKLCDFGVSGELIDSMAGTFTGTSFYMAPERITGSPYNITSDVWSLGLTVLELASNRFPFPAEGEPPLGPIDLLSYVVTMKVPELKDDAALGIRWTKAFRDFLEHCLEKDGSKRCGPTKMLNHPWMKKSMARVPQPDIAKFVADVWGWPTPQMTASHEAHNAIVAENIDVPHLGRVASIRKAPSPITPLSAALRASNGGIGPTASGEALSGALCRPAAPSSQQRHAGLSILVERGGVNAEGIDADGRTAQERALARQREADVGLVGSPTTLEGDGQS